MVRFAFLLLGAVAILGFPLSDALQSAAESRYPKVQWVENGRPLGDVERSLVQGLPTLRGNGPEGSVFVERRYRDRSRPFSLDAQIYGFARLGCLAALITSVAGFLLHRNLERLARIERGEAPL